MSGMCGTLHCTILHTGFLYASCTCHSITKPASERDFASLGFNLSHEHLFSSYVLPFSSFGRNENTKPLESIPCIVAILLAFFPQTLTEPQQTELTIGNNCRRWNYETKRAPHTKSRLNRRTVRALLTPRVDATTIKPRRRVVVLFWFVPSFSFVWLRESARDRDRSLALFASALPASSK